ncbi:hypothetical protein [Branchiibius sp. NY16-3462-2]|uniref:hypothetical protein n=1 Tax=Branchiibius sp. NY16-3462-2 TaxID=1807500 RepID=UPI00079B3FEB|nr:hypothetical protein [Branchiibius sp. NY16-3462-2]KYH45614.1 hypothetical protein AZH51_18005 [Branchiibius sp. NY16-3462-2]
MRSQLLATAAALVVTASAMTGCSQSSQENAIPDAATSLTPTDPPPASFSPLATAPLNFRTLAGKGFQIQVPASWQDNVVPATTTGGVPGVAAREPGRDPARPIGVAVVIDNDPSSDAVAQSEVLATTKSSLGQAKDVKRSMVKWPDTQYAVLVSWTETPQGTSDAYRVEQLFAQVSPKLIVNVVGKAPVADFATSGIERIMRTLVIKT